MRNNNSLDETLKKFTKTDTLSDQHREIFKNPNGLSKNDLRITVKKFFDLTKEVDDLREKCHKKELELQKNTSKIKELENLIKDKITQAQDYKNQRDPQIEWRSFSFGVLAVVALKIFIYNKL